MTHRYIGTKEITAWEQEKDGQPGYAVKYADGYTSWSPKDVFEEAYRVSEGDEQRLTFGDAIHFLKDGKRVVIKKGQVLTISPGNMTHDERREIMRNPRLAVGRFSKFKFFPKGIKDKPRFPTHMLFRDPVDM